MVILNPPKITRIKDVISTEPLAAVKSSVPHTNDVLSSKSIYPKIIIIQMSHIEVKINDQLPSNMSVIRDKNEVVLQASTTRRVGGLFSFSIAENGNLSG